MGVRSRLASLAKVFGSGEPPQIAEAEAASGMTPASPFSPGEPIGPYDGFSRTPRTQNFVTGYNISARPRSHERVAFSTLKGLIEAYDVAQMCCAPGTQIVTKRGLVAIEDVAVGDEVISHLGRWRRVTGTMVNAPHAPSYTLRARGLDGLVVTGNHPVFAIDYRLTQTRRREAQGIGWVSADRLKPSGHGRHHGMVLPALNLSDGRPQLHIAEILGEDYRANSDGLLARTRGGRLTAVPAVVEMGAALGRLLGWYLAEGSQGKGRTVVFSLGPDERGYAEQILTDARELFGLCGTVKPTLAGRGLTVTIHSSVLGSLLACGTARTKRLPQWAWDGGREFFGALLESWAAGDGCRTDRAGQATRVTVVTSSRDLAWQMRMVAIALGLEAFVQTTRRDIPRVTTIRGLPVRSAAVIHKVSWREKPRRHGTASFEVDGHYLATSLTARDPNPYDGPVYNLEVDEDHSYVTTGGTVHNCIWHRIDSIRSLEWSLVASKGYGGDVTDAVPVGMAALSKPDRDLPFENWLSAWLYDILAYDAGSLYRMRNLGGRAVGLRTVDGTTIAPLLDYWGNTPSALKPGDPEPEAYVQYANGLPWNWLTRSDLIYVPFRKTSSSPYGRAPLESILLNANTDLRFQQYFLQRFTEGNIPAAFAAAPETWTPQQIEQFQGYWDSFILGDQAVKSQIKWIPGGSRIEFANEHDFSDHFSLFLMRKTAAAYHVVPADLGFTENVNRSSGESQADVQHRVGDLPLIRHIQRILSSFLQDDLRLPLAFAFDLGEEQADRLQQAQADKIYVELGAISASDIREMRYGLPEPDGIPVPRFIFDTRSGPIPLASLYAVAGEIDPASGAPKPGSQLPHTVFAGVEGVAPEPPIKPVPLAEQEFGPGAVPVAPPPQPKAPDAPVAKDGAPTVGITTETGIVGYDLIGADGDERKPAGVVTEQDDVTKARTAELAAFRRYVRDTRRKGRPWRAFTFTTLDTVQAHRLNDAGGLTVRKSANQVAVAGLAVQAADTGRVLMLQRALDGEDPAAGEWEFPGGHIEGSEMPFQAAVREWSEETGCTPPDGRTTGEWTSPDGIYRGFVWTIAAEEDLCIFENRDQITNPDDPDGDQIEALAWWDPAQLPGNPAVRPELLDGISDVLAALGASVAKAGDGGNPKAGAPAPSWPGWDHDEAAASYWSPILAGALAGVLTVEGARLIAAGFLATRPESGPDADRKALIAEAAAYLAAQRLDLAGPLADRLAGLYTDGVLIGAAAAQAVIDASGMGLGTWAPGETSAAETLIAERGASEALDTLLAGAVGTAQGIAESRIDDMARTLADSTLAGASAGEAGQNLIDALANPSRADAVAITEITGASASGAMQIYLANGATHGKWVTEGDLRVCPRCRANAAAGLIPLGQPFPSGDVQPPGHGRCRCALLAG